MRRPFVLIVDDDEVTRSLLSLTLPDEGYDIVEAESGDAALQIAAVEAPALVILDWRMPGRSGADVLKQLKILHPGTPVVVLTAVPDRQVESVALDVGADLFVSKPFSPMNLLAAVERLLAERLVNKPA